MLDQWGRLWSAAIEDIQAENSLKLSIYSYASSMTGLADEEGVLLMVTPPGE